MNRRRFLQILAGTAAASTTAYFLPPISGWKSDVIASPHDGCNFACDGHHDLYRYGDPEMQAWISGKPLYLYGIPYYYSASTSGEYLGITRGDYPSRPQQKSALDRALANLNKFWENMREEHRAVIEA